MPKTDKEITSEIVCAFLHAWGGEGKKTPNSGELLVLVQDVFKTVCSLKDTSG
ncbi:MAG: hypothetical protein FWC70_05525 [Defluviitaleaceae bacterium]|nr:hypothetical protein [Defluviitaleaceae bacterium]